jgi:hypothetical protein
MCGDEVMCQIGDKALVVEHTTQARRCDRERSVVTYLHPRRREGRMSGYQVAAIIGKASVTLAVQARRDRLTSLRRALYPKPLQRNA